MALEHQRTMTVEEYFELEENDPDTRYEYIDGHVYAMEGGTANHDTITSNLQRVLSPTTELTDSHTVIWNSRMRTCCCIASRME